MGWRLQINFNDGSSEIMDDVFESEQDAQDEYEICLESWGVGRETLMLAGEDYDDSEIEDCDIWEE